MTPFSVFARWRPSEPSQPELPHKTQQEESHSSITLSGPGRPWTSSASFTHVFDPADNNRTVFEAVVGPALPQVLRGSTCNFFAYGHSGSGKTHTIIGYDYENGDELGLCLSAARYLSNFLDEINSSSKSHPTQPGDASDNLGLGIRMYELRKNTAFDLLNNHAECHVREGPDGRTHIRGQTELLADGKVRVRPIVTKPCWSFEDIRRELLGGLKLRATGSSSVHDQSSRTHAVIELEVVTESLLQARDTVIERQSELVPVGKRATDIYLDEMGRGLILNNEGKYVPNPEYTVDQARIDSAEAEKVKYEDAVREAEEYAATVFRESGHACLGGKLVFVDLAGSEYYHDKTTTVSSARVKQTPQEQREGRQINTDLLALKEVIRALASSTTTTKRIPFRSSPLTMVLREHFTPPDTLHQEQGQGQSAMILTVSPALDQAAATMNTLKYGNLMGVASRVT